MSKNEVWVISLWAFIPAILGLLLVTGLFFQLNHVAEDWLIWPLHPLQGAWEDVWPFYSVFLFVGLPVAVVVYGAVWWSLLASRAWPYGGRMADVAGGLWWSLGYLGLAWLGLVHSLVLLIL